MSLEVHFTGMNRMNFWISFLKTNQRQSILGYITAYKINCFGLNRKQKMFKQISIVYQTQTISSASFQIRNLRRSNVKLYCASNEIRKNQPETSAKVLSKLNVIKNLDFKEYKERSTVILQNKWTNVYTFYERVFHMVHFFDMYF